MVSGAVISAGSFNRDVYGWIPEYMANDYPLFYGVVLDGQSDQRANSGAAFMYKITATIHKPGGLPVSWFRRSPKKLSKRECENMIYRSKEAGRSFGDKVVLTDFKCEKE